MKRFKKRGIKISILFLLVILLIQLMGCTKPALSTDTDTTQGQEASPTTAPQTAEPTTFTEPTTSTELPATTEPPATEPVNTDAEQNEDPYREVYQALLDNHKDEIHGSLWLPGGGVLFMMDTPDETGTDPEATTLEMYQVTMSKGRPDVRQLRLTGAIEGKVPIFYDEDWEDRYTGEDHYTLTSYDSGFVPLEGQEGSLLLIEVFPNRVRDTAYEASEFFEIKPEDNLGTVPMEVFDADWNEGYPAWFFVLDPAEITEDYELRYGDFILTGMDILTDSWTIGDAPQFPRF